MSRQENEDGNSGFDKGKDRLAIGVLVSVPLFTAIAVAVTFAFQGPSAAVSEIFIYGLNLTAM